MYAGHDAQKCLCYIGVFVFFSSNAEMSVRKQLGFRMVTRVTRLEILLHSFFFAMGVVACIASFGKFGRNVKMLVMSICILDATRKGSHVLKSCCTRIARHGYTPSKMTSTLCFHTRIFWFHKIDRIAESFPSPQVANPWFTMILVHDEVTGLPSLKLISAPEHIGFPKRKIVFQPPIFRYPITINYTSHLLQSFEVGAVNLQ